MKTCLANTVTENWIAVELTFQTKEQYNPVSCEAFFIKMDVVFTHEETKETLCIPAFWYEEKVFKVRFAPVREGLWTYRTVCAEDASLNGLKGIVLSKAYQGELEIYKRGFVTTGYGHKYFTYADGTPFFYLGDTHWTMFTEELDEAGSHAGGIETDSHFKYIVDKRVEQGYTVYQSEPIGAPFDISAGKMNRRVINGFQEADAYFAYIAQKGLVHANAQFFFTAEMTDALAADKAYLQAIARHWVARYGAYPVMWTLAQECDNDFYAETAHNKHAWATEHNPWIDVAEYIHTCDAYRHPISGHQEGASFTTVTGKGTTAAKVSKEGKSMFLSPEITFRTGHDWWAAQWKQNINGLPNFSSAKDYWASPKVGINYEDRYAYLWTKDFGARVRGWLSFLNGFFGYGYGCADLWYYKSTYDMKGDSVLRDGLETITEEEKQMKWCEAIKLESGVQVCYMKQFFTEFEWWRLVPDFDEQKYFLPEEGCLYSCATEQNQRYVVCLYNRTEVSGCLKGLSKADTYTVKWFNPRTGTYAVIEPFAHADEEGRYRLPKKPDAMDWVILAQKTMEKK